jgi:hypothetical protein
MWPFGRKKSPDNDLPEAMTLQARQNPGGWAYEIDGAIGDAMGEVPPFAIKGARKVDDAGMIVGEFEPNKNYDREKTLAWVAARDTAKE